MSKHLHIISFNIPYPPNYGGVMDVYFKIKALHAEGVQVHLHCFEYGREEAAELNQICASVNYYQRSQSWLNIPKLTPYIVATRKNDELLSNLLKDDYPILFEGIHTCAYLDHADLKNRVKAVRMHNVEWDYYFSLGKIETSMFRKFYFYTESLKLKYFEKILVKADVILVISQNDFDYVNEKFKNVFYLPAFHPNYEVESKPGLDNFAMYHGNLGVGENNQAAMFLVTKVFAGTEIPFMVAGSDPSDMLVHEIKKHRNIQLHVNVNADDMNKLISKAQVHVLPTFQSTGVKLKLLNALFRGRHVIANNTMVEKTGLETLCHIKNKAEEIKLCVEELMKKPFTESEIQLRKDVLMKSFSNSSNALKLMPLLFGQNQ